MGNNNLKTTNDILVKVDINNLIYIDPNSILSNGLAAPRSIEPENLIMYVNLEADLVPRTILAAEDNQNTLLSIARGTLNFMKKANPNGKTKTPYDTDFDTKWTEVYTDVSSDNFNQNDTSGQSFGIDNVSIKIAGANFIPSVSIKFIDVRGKTLFDSPRDSPYSAFFHLPWPIFYLTVKGYYGKAIRYRLHMIKFNSKFNPANGNFEVDATFIGSTYAYLADIPLEWVLNAPYFYLSENIETTQYNKETGYYDVTITKSTKGYRVLRSVYQEYISKGLLPKDFPVKTLREIIIIAGRLNKILENEVFAQTVDAKVLAGVKDFEEQVEGFYNSVQSWSNRYLSSRTDFFTSNEKQHNSTEPVRWYRMRGDKKNTLEWVEGKDISGTLEFIIYGFAKRLAENPTFGVGRDNSIFKDKNFIVKPISLYQFNNIKNFYKNDQGTYGIDIDGLLDDINNVEKDFVEQRNKLETDIEQKMNEIIKKPDKGIGFEPTIRNIIGVLLANAETYIRLMKDVHTKAFDQGPERKKKLTEVSTDSIGDAIYPWPEVKTQVAGSKDLVLSYPASKELIGKLKADDPILWPEVDFVENFYEIATKKADNLTTKEGNPENINYVFATGIKESKKDIGMLTNISGIIPYGDKSQISILYEIYERAKYVTSFSPFSNDVMQELGSIEFDNLSAQISEDIDIVDMLKTKITSYDQLLYNMAPSYDRYSYFKDQLPTVPYIKNAISEDFIIKKYQKNLQNQTTHEDQYTKLQGFLSNYKTESYRSDIYPFNSTLYQSYLTTNFDAKSLNLSGILKANPPEDFITSPVDPFMWVKSGYTTNLFTNLIKIGDEYKHILNTPYFHKQLYDDFIKSQPSEKYVGSAYLLLNSLPFKDLDEKMIFTSLPSGNQPLMSSIFREIGSTHYIPYHLMIKWGSIYHRYKKYINDGVDIIQNVTTRIDGDLFFDNVSGRTYTTMSGITVDRSTNSDVGFHPYYENVFHKIVNDYGFFDQVTGPSSYSTAISNGIINTNYRIAHGANAWASFINASTGITTYTLLPCNGYNDIDGSEFIDAEQENFRILWNIGTTYTPNYVDYSSYTFPSTYEYFKSTGSTGTYSLSTNYKKVIDLIATFKPDILDVFEAAFLDFASENLNEETAYKIYDVQNSTFQDLLKSIVSIPKNNSDPTDINGLITKIKEKQTTSLSDITCNMLSSDSLIKISLANPREIDNYLLTGFTSNDPTHFDLNEFDSSQVAGNLDNINLYLGEDLDGYYQDFFQLNNIELNEDNIKQFRFLIYPYAGLRATGQNPTKSEFITYLNNTIISPTSSKIDSTIVSGPEDRLRLFLDKLIYRIQKELNASKPDKLNKKRGYGDDIIKLELYNMFKSFNDKWTAGNSIGQRTLMEEFLFLDKANRDIGDSVYIDMEKLTRLTAKGNEKINLFSAISLLVQDTGFDIRALPAYVNFYSANGSSTGRKSLPSKNVAQIMFGSFLEVDYVDSSPKIILQYIGPTSKHPEMSEISKRNKFPDDGCNVGDTHNNPILIDDGIFSKTDISKSNRVVAFEVSFGDQNQSIFKGVELDQTSIKNTSESFIVLDRLGRSESGSSTAQVDIGLFDIYRQSSYQCQVSCMGNVMIQPTMYFYLKNIPLFKGSYWITEVTHNIKTSGIETIFKGTRMPLQSLPNPLDSFMASYRSFFDRMVKNSVTKVQKERESSLTASTINEKTIVDSSGSHSYSVDNINVPGEKNTGTSGYMPYGIPYNGFDPTIDKDIQLVTNVNFIVSPIKNTTEWLRTRAVMIGGIIYKPLDNVAMSVLSRLTGDAFDNPRMMLWGDIKEFNDKQNFYFSKFNIPDKIKADDLINKYPVTEFLNPITKRSMTIPSFMSVMLKKYEGPVSKGPSIDGYGIALSQSLMKKLGLVDGDVVYFRLY